MFSSIRRLVLSAFVVAASGGFLPPAHATEVDRPKKVERPRVEMVFALDTTGSMGSLIAGAKQKIWGIVNEVVKGQPTPEVRIGLVAYRDKGDAYVTQVSQLTGDLDAVYKDLMALQAGGGGDGPENVNQALHDALHKIEWSGKGVRALRVIFLVGDAPPHMDYQEVPSYERTVTAAAQKGVLVNAIRCGAWEETGTHWAKIARLGGGEFLTIDGSGGMVATRSPYDDRLAELSREMDSTYVLAGDETKRRRARRALDDADRTAGSGGSYAKAERAIFRAASKAPAAPAPAAEADLVTRFDEDEAAAVAELERVEALPEPMKEMTVEERKAHVKAQAEKRKRVKEEMAKVAKDRDAWLAEKSTKKADSFDAKVGEVIKTQATAAIDVAY